MRVVALCLVSGLAVSPMSWQALPEPTRVPSSSGDTMRPEKGLEIEDRVPAGVRDGLAARGPVVRALGSDAMSTGITAVGAHPATGTLRGGADVRRERYMGWQGAPACSDPPAMSRHWWFDVHGIMRSNR